MKNSTDTYKEVRTFTDSSMTARVHIPDLTEEERTRRMKAIYVAAAELLKSVAMNKKEELIDRIEKLTAEQFELLISLHSQQEQEFVRVSQSDHQTFLQPCV